MGLISFLQKQGYIQDTDPEDKPAADKSAKDSSSTVAPTYFPLADTAAGSIPGNNNAVQPSFVQNIEQPVSNQSMPDAAFVKFYEEELAKQNTPGPDYFEFRQQLVLMNKKMAGKGASSDLILQSVLTGFEAQNVPASKLAESANYYKSVLDNKRKSFIDGAEAEKNKQLQTREATLQNHQNNITAYNQQITDLERQLQQLRDKLMKEQVQMESDKTMGKESIVKLEKAVAQVNLAYDYMRSAIEKDIQNLQS